MQVWNVDGQHLPTNYPHLCATFKSTNFRMQFAMDAFGNGPWVRSRGSQPDEWSEWMQLARKTDIPLTTNAHIDPSNRIQLIWHGNSGDTRMEMTVDGTSVGYIATNLDPAVAAAARRHAVELIASLCGMSSYLNVHVIAVGQTVDLGTRNNYTYHTAWDDCIGQNSWAVTPKIITNLHKWGGHISGSGTRYTGVSEGYDFVSLTNPDTLLGIIVIPNW